MSLSYSYELPFGPGRKFLSGAGGAAAGLVEGWGVRGITTFSSGSPRRLIVSRGIINSGAGVNPHPFRISDGNLPASQRSIDRWFDTAAFPLPARFTLGNSGRNIIIGPGLNNFDISVFKNTRISESQRIEFRAEFFNGFNHRTSDCREETRRARGRLE